MPETPALAGSTSTGRTDVSSAASSAQTRHPVRARVAEAPPHPRRPPLLPSFLRPACPAADRIRLWLPASTRRSRGRDGRPEGISDADLEKVQLVLGEAWAESTRTVYGSGLLAYHVLCDSRSIPEEQRAPASDILIAPFIASLAGAYSVSTIRNYVYGVRAWHLIHGAAWRRNQDELDTILRGALQMAPKLSTRAKREPYTLAYLRALRDHLNLTDPLDAAVWAVLTVAFFSLARLGELLLNRLDGFQPGDHITPQHLTRDSDRDGRLVWVLHVPRTKTASAGEDLCFAPQEEPLDPVAALQNHLAVNRPHDRGPLFSYLKPNSPQSQARPLTKRAFCTRLAQVASAAHLETLKGHSLRIGGTLEFLLRGVPFEVVKTMGRWKSDAFQLYLRKHAQILAPYWQVNPPVHEAFTRYSMPPVR